MNNQAKPFMVNLAQEAGSMLKGHFRRDPELTAARSTAKEAATKYDKLVDQFINEKIKETYPTHSILTEESGHHGKRAAW